MLCAGARMRSESYLSLGWPDMFRNLRPLNSATDDSELGSLLGINLNSLLPTSFVCLWDSDSYNLKYKSSKMAKNLNVRQSWVHVPALPFTSCMALSKSLKISEKLSSSRKWYKSSFFFSQLPARHVKALLVRKPRFEATSCRLELCRLCPFLAVWPWAMFSISESQLLLHNIGLIVTPAHTSWVINNSRTEKSLQLYIIFTGEDAGHEEVNDFVQGRTRVTYRSILSTQPHCLLCKILTHHPEDHIIFVPFWELCLRHGFPTLQTQASQAWDIL